MAFSVLAAASLLHAQESTTSVWQTDLETAKQAAQASGRLLVVHFWAPWCAPCRDMETNVFSQPGFEQAITAGFVPVKLDVDNHATVTSQYGVTQIPADLVLAPDGRLIEKLPAATNAAQYLSALNQVATRFRMPAAPPGSGPPAYAGAPASVPTNPPGGYPPPVAGYAPAGSAMPPQNAAPIGAPMNQQTIPPYAAAANQRPLAASPPGASVGPPGFQGAQTGPAGPATAGSAAMYGQPGVSQTNLPAAAVAAPQPQVVAPLGLDGYCPVALSEQRRWVPGNREWGFVYRGRTYYFSSEEAKQRFWNNPDNYAPVGSGVDPVIAVEQHQEVPGSRSHGLYFDNRIYLFAGEQSLQKFQQNPERYATEMLQARR